MTEPTRERRSGVDWVLTAVGMLIFAYMAYATLFGPYKTTIVHLALFACAMLCIAFLDRTRSDQQVMRSVQWGLDATFAAATIVTMGYVIVNFERLINLWGSSYLTGTDVAIGVAIIVISLEAARRHSTILFALGVFGVVYMLYGAYFPGVMQHAGMDLKRIIYLTAYTTEGFFGTGLSVAASYLFMFMMLGSALQATRTGDFIMKVANATTGRQVGGAAKSAMVASAGLGTMVGSSVGNVVTTGTFTIPLMIRTGFRPHVAAAVETNTSEGAQLVPPILGAAAFIMAQLTGIPYATIAVAAILPAVLYYLSLYCVVHFEARKAGLAGIPEDEIPSLRQSFADGWHLLVAPAVLFYLLIVESYTPSYASLIAIGIAMVCGLARSVSRMPFRAILDQFDSGARQAAAITALIVSIGLLQAAIVTTGLGPRIADIILSVSDGSLLMTAILAVVAATLLGMGMPTPIAYLLLAMFTAPALTAAGAPLLGAHLFLFYFAIKSGSTPPVALVAVVAAGIARANWWSTAVTAFVHSLPGFIVAFMFLFSPALLLQGDPMTVALSACSAAIGVFAMAAAVQGWCAGRINWIERALLAAAAISLINPGYLTDIAGVAVVALIYLRRARLDGIQSAPATGAKHQNT
ncbi:TRAP transporter fused permease subunit [Nitratireductor aquimarinus]|uniref:TRAP transporter permease n=1 Tax=Nitratireductor aquimarinus TaxID=889300 RepID=UPI002936716C|nr:TRAP transporter fused permease subunit [Nitratireductor aquimarinus]MDV2967743.1 TRAP transporter fused permease subunit [Nitratireductor aquimarinus]